MRAARAAKKQLPMSQELDTTAPELGYWRETRQPIYSAALVLPFLLIYELGLLCLRSEVINGGDAILLNLGGKIMKRLGLQAGLASVAVLALFFIVAQIKRRGGWSVRPKLLAAAFFESGIYAVLLFMLLVYFVPYLPQGRARDGAPPGSARNLCASETKPAPPTPPPPPPHWPARRRQARPPRGRITGPTGQACPTSSCSAAPEYTRSWFSV